MRPACITWIVCETLRAKCIAWVTTIIVWPLWARSVITLDHFGGHARVERAGGLVEQDRLGVHGEGAGDGDALLLAAGELVGAGGEFFGEADAVEQLAGFGFALVARAAERRRAGRRARSPARSCAGTD